MWGASAAVAMIGLYFCFFYMYDWRGREEPTTAPTAAQLPLSEPAHQQFTRKDHP
jgi:hypothetical protein